MSPTRLPPVPSRHAANAAAPAQEQWPVLWRSEAFFEDLDPQDHAAPAVLPRGASRGLALTGVQAAIALTGAIGLFLAGAVDGVESFTDGAAAIAVAAWEVPVGR